MAYKNKEDAKKYYHDYYIKYKEKKQKQKRILYLKNRENILRKNKEKRREFRKLHPIVKKTDEEIKEKERLWRNNNKEKRNVYMRLWGQKNKEHLSEWKRKRYNERLSIKERYKRLIAGAKRKNISYEVKILEQEFGKIVEQPCVYCGEIKIRRGIDRIDNSIGYTKENSVSCCKICNRMKREMSVNNFLGHIKKIYLHNQK